MDNEEHVPTDSLIRNKLLSCNLSRDSGHFDTDSELFERIIKHFDKIYRSSGLDFIVFTINSCLDVSVQAYSPECNTDILRKSIPQIGAERIKELFYADFNSMVFPLEDNKVFWVSKIYSDNAEAIFMGIYGPDSADISSSLFAGLSESFLIISNKLRTHREMLRLKIDNKSLRFSINLLRVTNQINEFLIRSMDEDDIYSILLLGITAGQGLGFNRCFIFRLSSDKDTLVGERAIGPLDPFEAQTTWEKVEKQYASFKDILSSFRSADIIDMRSNKLIKRISISIKSDAYNPFKDIFSYNQPMFIQFIDPFYRFARDFFDLTGITSFVAYPIKIQQEEIGIIIADNRFTNKYPSNDELQLLQTIILQASAIIQNIRLYEQLNKKMESIKSTQKEINENREKLYMAEKYSIAGEILEKIAHTLKNPLVTIGGFSRSLQKPNISEQKRKQYASILLKEVQRIEKILEDVLNFSKETAPDLKLHDINEIIRESAGILSQEIEQEKAKLSLELNSLLPNIMVDKSQINQVIINIIRNAFYAARKIGKTPEIQIESIRSGEFIVISVSDNGMGIAEEHIDKLFNAFFSTKEIGTGLGLTISGQIIRNHKGHLTVKSEPDKGSTFSIHLPIEQ